MTSRSVLCLVGSLVAVGLGVRPAEAATYDLYYLGGQSNMDGYGFVSELPEGWSGPVERVMIFQGNQGVDGEKAGGEGLWAPLQPGFGTGFARDGVNNR